VIRDCRGREKDKKEGASMNEEQKRQVAIFRFGVIHDFVGGVRLERGEQQETGVPLSHGSLRSRSEPGLG